MAKGGQSDQMKSLKKAMIVTDLFYYKYGTFSLQLFVINLKPSTHHLPRLALLFAGGVIFVYLM